MIRQPKDQRTTAKNKLIELYDKMLGAYHFKNQRMIIETQAARILVGKYFKILKQWA